MKPDFTWFFLSFKGRIARQEFWLGYVGFLVAIFRLKRPLDEFFLSLFRPKSGPWFLRELEWALVVSKFVLFALTSWPLAAICVKRLHDLNLSAWWLLILPMIVVASEAMGLGRFNIPLWVSLAVLGLVPGSRGGNRFDIEPATRT